MPNLLPPLPARPPLPSRQDKAASATLPENSARARLTSAKRPSASIEDTDGPWAAARLQIEASAAQIRVAREQAQAAVKQAMQVVGERSHARHRPSAGCVSSPARGPHRSLQVLCRPRLTFFLLLFWMVCLVVCRSLIFQILDGADKHSLDATELETAVWLAFEGRKVAGGLRPQGTDVSEARFLALFEDFGAAAYDEPGTTKAAASESGESARRLTALVNRQKQPVEVLARALSRAETFKTQDWGTEKSLLDGRVRMWRKTVPSSNSIAVKTVGVIRGVDARSARQLMDEWTLRQEAISALKEIDMDVKHLESVDMPVSQKQRDLGVSAIHGCRVECATYTPPWPVLAFEYPPEH